MKRALLLFSVAALPLMGPPGLAAAPYHAPEFVEKFQQSLPHSDGDLGAVVSRIRDLSQKGQLSPEFVATLMAPEASAVADDASEEALLGRISPEAVRQALVRERDWSRRTAARIVAVEEERAGNPQDSTYSPSQADDILARYRDARRLVWTLQKVFLDDGQLRKRMDRCYQQLEQAKTDIEQSRLRETEASELRALGAAQAEPAPLEVQPEPTEKPGQAAVRVKLDFWKNEGLIVDYKFFPAGLEIVLAPGMTQSSLEQELLTRAAQAGFPLGRVAWSSPQASAPHKNESHDDIFEIVKGLSVRHLSRQDKDHEHAFASISFKFDTGCVDFVIFANPTRSKVHFTSYDGRHSSFAEYDPPWAFSLLKLLLEKAEQSPKLLPASDQDKAWIQEHIAGPLAEIERSKDDPLARLELQLPNLSLTAPSPGAAPAPQANTEEAVQKFIRGNLPALNSLKRYSHIDGYSIEHDENGYFLRIALNNHDRDLQEHRTKTEEEVAQMRNGEPAQIRIEYVASGTPPAP